MSSIIQLAKWMHRRDFPMRHLRQHDRTDILVKLKRNNSEGALRNFYTLGAEAGV